MEEMMDFDEWFANYKPEPIKYVAVFDQETGKVTSVGPSHAFENIKNKISIDSDVAESIIKSEIKIHNCVVDIHSSTLEIAEIKTIVKIDDLLHRVISKKYSRSTNNEVYLTHNTADKTLTIELIDFLGGTRQSEISTQKRKIIWDGDTDLVFLVTAYNDPNLLLDTISVKINELTGESKVIKGFEYDNFSIYTRRLFKNYVIETL